MEERPSDGAETTTATAPPASQPRRAATWRRSLGLAVVGIAIVAGVWLLDDGQLFGAGEGGLAGASNADVARVGRPAPDFVLRDLEGQPVRLSELRGKTVLLNFWATWCPPCRAEIPDIERVYQEYRDKGVVVLAVDQQEDAESVRTFAQSVKMSFPILLDRTGEVGRRYRVSGIPTTVFVDAQGVVRAMNVGAMSRLGLVGRLELVR